jgi:hypothetical protein
MESYDMRYVDKIEVSKIKKKVDFHKICCLFSLNTFNKIKLVASRTLKLLGDW